ncbi:MAG: histidinol dehydrogenase [Bacteroidales bacterium]|nr:histidinol dehydrogenase [Candidatus Cacconaster merdequi]
MNIVINPGKEQWKALAERVTADNSEIEERVRAIVAKVKAGGDAALREIAEEIDGFVPDDFRVSAKEFEDAFNAIDSHVREAIDRAYENIYAFHKAEVPRRITVRTAEGVTCIQKPVPIGSVGLYIPGGTAPLFSTVLMLGVPSLIAGCPRRILCTPVGKNGRICSELLYSAWKCGIRDIFKIGGAQAIAAMAHGTGSIPKVDRIFGPGNRYVTCAKQLVSRENVSIDMPAGPSEVMVLADRTASPVFVAADLLSQAEHGRDSQAILVTTDETFAGEVFAEVERQASLLPRREMVEGSLAGSCIIVFDEKAKLSEFADYYAPEHLIISMEDADEIAENITAAGSVFIGNYTPESAGDYASGTNHTLPTSGWARSFSGVNIDSFIRKMTLQKITPEGLRGLSDTIVSMAEAEGLQAHANAVKVRIGAMGEAGEGESCKDISSLVRENIASLSPYSTARDDFKGKASIYLDANESPFNNGFNRYPDPRQAVLKERISAIKGQPVERIFIGNGSDEAIDLMYRIFCMPGRDNAVAVAPTYGMYKVAAAINDVEYREVQLGDDFSFDADAVLSAADKLTKLLFICSPNNPTGNAFDCSDIMDVARRFNGIVVVDEAYIDFSGKGTMLGCGLNNVVVLQTLSKARGMAGLRLGLAFADPYIIGLMSSVKYPYNISQAAIDKAMDMLKNPVADQVATLIEERAKLAAALERVGIVKRIWPSDANFILARFDDPNAMYDYLSANGVIVRNRNSVRGCEGCLRLTVGTPEENEQLIKLLLKYEEGNIH